MRRHLWSMLPVLVAVAVTHASAAGADVFGPASLLSTSTNEQMVDAHDPALSSDGLYVAFDGTYEGLTGVWRRKLDSPIIEPVAVGGPQTPQGSAELPSISADGRYVSFTTTARLDPADDLNEGPDVYVRDMDEPGGEPCAPPSEEQAGIGERAACAFTLVSARNGSRAGLDYSYGSSPEIEQLEDGSVASGRSALSADGNQVAFVTTAVSDLAGPGTPALQVAVRNIEAQTTQLVSVREDTATGAPAVDTETGQPEPVSSLEGAEVYGAVFTGSGAHIPNFRAPQPREPPIPLGASISADGSTVAWMGTNVELQAPMLAEESTPAKYSEPLWRRIADGPQAPVRRVTGGSDPASAACAESGETALTAPPSLSDPCQGPFATLTAPATPGVVSGLEGDDDVTPRLSADGYTIAFLANAPLVALGEGFGVGGDAHADLYIVDMHPGPTRAQALRALTELASGDGTDLASTAPIVDLSVSPDGSEVAFTTKRTQFPLGSPAYVDAPSTSAGMVELFDVDLANDTLTRVTQGFEGGPSEHPHPSAHPGEDPYTSAGDGALSPSFSADGNTLAFSSTASNLVYGDGNTPPATQPFGAFDGSDVFAVSRTVFGSAPASQYLGPSPVSLPPSPQWLLGVTAQSRRDGSVLLEATVPGSGKLRASARGALVVKAHARSARRGHRAREGRRSRLKRVVSTTVASGGTAAKRPALIKLTLRLAKRYSSLASRAGGLSATVTVTFTAPGHRTLRQQLQVTFARRAVRRTAASTKRRGRTRHA